MPAPASNRANAASPFPAPAANSCDVGLIGLGVMGQNLVLNLADHGYCVAVYNRTTAATEAFIREHGGDRFTGSGALAPCATLEEFLGALKQPRIMIVLVKAGKPVDLVCQSLIEAGIARDDIVVDGGNSLWTDTIRRERDYREQLLFFGSGVSGGEIGARFGPSLMPGGDAKAWQRLKPIWESIAAKIDPMTGRPIEDYAPGKPITRGEPCTAYIGANGAGHYVKMVHNGIEYADMQLIAEAYDLLRRELDLSPIEIGDVFAEWNAGDLESYLIEITADILRQRDPITGEPFVDIVLDRAEQKGTGRWTAQNALELGIPATAIVEAVFARAVSAQKDERAAAAKVLRGPAKTKSEHHPDTFIDAVRDALYCSKLCAYAQGFALMQAAQQEYDWELDFGSIASIWRGGCIIRARFLQKITDAYSNGRRPQNLIMDEYFRAQIEGMQNNWRLVVAAGIQHGIPCPAFASTLAWFDAYRTERLPANLIQAQRDYFGAHTYERVDQARGKYFHLDWPEPKRPQLVATE